MNYVTAGASNPINTQGMPWCIIYQFRGHNPEECLYLHVIVSTLASMYCKFCKTVGHNEKYYKSFQFLQEKTMDTYLMKNDEKMQAE